ncbi:MAG: saccharopine dehydrogenase family protein [Sciscionella sp.]
MTWMLYGANGYTGRLIAQVAARRGEQPIMAGRTAGKIAPIANELGFDHRQVGLSDPAALRVALRDVDVVAHCAGPFSATAAPMMDACLATGTHYLDITGEIDVFEAVYARHHDALRAGVVLLPGAGFDVVPTDCVAATLAAEMPDATELHLAFHGTVKIGPGTAKTAIEGAGTGGRARVGGRLRSVPLAHRHVTAEFPSGPKVVHAIPWGDVSSAYRSTGIPDITTYTVLPGGRAIGKGSSWLAPVLRTPVVQRAGKALVQRLLTAPASAEAGGRAQVWGQVRDASGARLSLTMTLPAAIPFTADSVLRAVNQLRAGGVEAGAHTPSTAFGAGFAAECDGVALGEPH